MTTDLPAALAVCQNCGKKCKGTVTWLGENGNIHTWTHGGGREWCMLCIRKAQLAFAKRTAKRIPRLEKEVKELSNK